MFHLYCYQVAKGMFHTIHTMSTKDHVQLNTLTCKKHQETSSKVRSDCNSNR